MAKPWSALLVTFWTHHLDSSLRLSRIQRLLDTDNQRRIIHQCCQLIMCQWTQQACCNYVWRQRQHARACTPSKEFHEWHNEWLSTVMKYRNALPVWRIIKVMWQIFIRKPKVHQQLEYCTFGLFFQVTNVRMTKSLRKYGITRLLSSIIAPKLIQTWSNAMPFVGSWSTPYMFGATMTQPDYQWSVVFVGGFLESDLLSYDS